MHTGAGGNALGDRSIRTHQLQLGVDSPQRTDAPAHLTVGAHTNRRSLDRNPVGRFQYQRYIRVLHLRGDYGRITDTKRCMPVEGLHGREQQRHGQDEHDQRP